MSTNCRRCGKTDFRGKPGSWIFPPLKPDDFWVCADCSIEDPTWISKNAPMPVSEAIALAIEALEAGADFGDSLLIEAKHQNWMTSGIESELDKITEALEALRKLK